MSHTFLLEPGRWLIKGNWQEKNAAVIPLKGGIIVSWSEQHWFTMVSKLMFINSDREEISGQYRGRLDQGQCQYTFVLNLSFIAKIEGEGWIGADSIIQRFWSLGDAQRRSGFETFYRIDDNTYHLVSAIMAGHYLTSTMEAVLERQT